MEKMTVSERRVCRVLGQRRWTQRKTPRWLGGPHSRRAMVLNSSPGRCGNGSGRPVWRRSTSRQVRHGKTDTACPSTACCVMNCLMGDFLHTGESEGPDRGLVGAYNTVRLHSSLGYRQPRKPRRRHGRPPAPLRSTRGRPWRQTQQCTNFQPGPLVGGTVNHPRHDWIRRRAPRPSPARPGAARRSAGRYPPRCAAAKG